MDKKIKRLDYRESRVLTEQGCCRNAINFCKEVFVFLNGVNIKPY